MTVKLEKFDHIIYHKNMFIQYPSYTTHVKIILQATSFGSGFEHHQALSKSKGTENYTTVVLSGYLVFKINLKKFNFKVFCIFILGQDLMMVPSQRRI